MLVREVMTSPAVTVAPGDTLTAAAQTLLRHRIASAPVVDDGGALRGMVSEADLVRGRTAADPRAHLIPVPDAEDPAGAVVEAVMTSAALTVRPDQDVGDAARILLGQKVKALPVVEGHRVVGVVARRDLLRALARSDDDILREVRGLFAELGLGDGWQVTVHEGVVELSGPQDPKARNAAAALARTVAGVTRVSLSPPAG